MLYVSSTSEAYMLPRQAGKGVQVHTRVMYVYLGPVAALRSGCKKERNIVKKSRRCTVLPTYYSSPFDMADFAHKIYCFE